MEIESVKQLLLEYDEIRYRPREDRPIQTEKEEEIVDEAN